MKEVKGISVSADTIEKIKEDGFAYITIAPNADFSEGETIAIVHGYDTLICIITEQLIDEVMHLTLERSFEVLPRWQV